MDSKSCKVPCLLCREQLIDLNPEEEGNQPASGTEFVGGGDYGSAITDHPDFRYAINICDKCVRTAIVSHLVLKVETFRPRVVSRYMVLEPPSPLEVAADTFAEHFCAHRRDMSIGLGADKLMVWVRGSEQGWKDRVITEWQGFPVQWNFDSGIVVASMNSPDASPSDRDT